MVGTVKHSDSEQATPRQRVQVDFGLILPFVLAFVLLAVLAWPMLRWWGWEWTKPESYYAHAPIIPFLSALMLWHRREALKTVPKAFTSAAFVLLLPALALLVFAIKTDVPNLQSVGFIGTLWGAAWLALGGRFVRLAWLPLGFLALMAPLPGPVLNDATLGLQMFSTHAAAKLLGLIGFANTMNGNIIALENYSLFVDVPCSGFKMLLAYATFSAAFCALVDGDLRRRVGLFLFSLPLALAVNAVRIALVGVVGECVGADAAHVFHDWDGLIMLCLGFVALFAVAKRIGCRTFAGLAIF